MPLLIGSTHASIALAAIAASTALPPAFKNVEPGLRRQRMARRHDAMLGDHDRSALVRVSPGGHSQRDSFGQSIRSAIEVRKDKP